MFLSHERVLMSLNAPRVVCWQFGGSINRKNPDSHNGWQGFVLWTLVLLRMPCIRSNQPPAMRVRIDCYTKKSPFRYNIGVQANIAERKGDFMANKANDMAHTKWMCKYHIVFTPKYRRKIIYNQYKEDLRDIIKQLCSYKGVTIIEGHLMPDHIHMLVSIPPKISVSSFMGYLKGKSALMMFDKHANLKYKFGNRHFWSEG